MRAVVLSIWMVFAFVMISIGNTGKYIQVFVNIHIDHIVRGIVLADSNISHAFS